MSAKHPIISITGSSGAGTTSVTRTFENIFRREGISAAIIEGDSFHRYDRVAMKAAMAEAEKQDRPHFSHFGEDSCNWYTGSLDDGLAVVNFRIDFDPVVNDFYSIEPTV